MCVVGQVFGSRRYTAYCKGAPEKIIAHCLKESSNLKKKLETIYCLMYYSLLNF